MDGIQAELNAAVNAFNQNEFQKMLEETEQVLDASTQIRKDLTKSTMGFPQLF